MDEAGDEQRLREEDEDEDEDEYTDENTITFKQRKSKYGRRTQVEVLFGFVVHLLMFYWVFVHVYDSTVVKSLSEDARRVAFPTHDQFLGRWRFLTYINLVRRMIV